VAFANIKSCWRFLERAGKLTTLKSQSVIKEKMFHIIDPRFQPFKAFSSSSVTLRMMN